MSKYFSSWTSKASGSLSHLRYGNKGSRGSDLANEPDLDPKDEPGETVFGNADPPFADGTIVDVVNVPTDRCACFMHSTDSPEEVKWATCDPDTLIFELEYRHFPSETMESGCTGTNGRYAIRVQSGGQSDDDLVEPRWPATHGPSQRTNDANISGYSTKMRSLYRMRALTIATRNNAQAREAAPTFTIGRLSQKSMVENLIKFNTFKNDVEAAHKRDELASLAKVSIGIPWADDATETADRPLGVGE